MSEPVSVSFLRAPSSSLFFFLQNKVLPPYTKSWQALPSPRCKESTSFFCAFKSQLPLSKSLRCNADYPPLLSLLFNRPFLLPHNVCRHSLFRNAAAPTGYPPSFPSILVVVVLFPFFWRRRSDFLFLRVDGVSSRMRGRCDSLSS